MLEGSPWTGVPGTDTWIILSPEQAGDYRVSVRVENNGGKVSMSAPMSVTVKGMIQKCHNV